MGEASFPTVSTHSTSYRGIPQRILTFSEAKEIYKKELHLKHKDFFVDAFIGTYEDDQNFDGINGIWFKWKINLRILKHFRGIITPDFSTYRDFPFPLRIWNTYRMRAYGYFAGKQGLEEELVYDVAVMFILQTQRLVFERSVWFSEIVDISSQSLASELQLCSNKNCEEFDTEGECETKFSQEITSLKN